MSLRAGRGAGRAAGIYRVGRRCRKDEKGKAKLPLLRPGTEGNARIFTPKGARYRRMTQGSAQEQGNSTWHDHPTPTDVRHEHSCIDLVFLSVQDTVLTA